MAKNNSAPKTTKKYAAMITYIIAVLCLLAGLLIPLGNAEGFTAANMLGWQLPKALGKMIPALGDKITFGADFTYGYTFKPFGFDFNLDLGASLALTYGLTTVIALILLIPVCASKKTSKTALNTASFIEVFALVILSIFLFTQLIYACENPAALALILGFEWHWSYALLIAFGGTLLMLIVQSIIYRKGSGFIKFILFLLSAAAVLFVVFPVGTLIPALADPLSKLAGSIKLTGGLTGENTESIFELNKLFTTAYALKDGEVTEKIMQVFGLIVALLIVINYFFDLMGLGGKASRGKLIVNVVRYGLELVSALVLIIMAAVLKTGIGIMLVLVIALAAIAFLINLIRLLASKKVKAKEKAVAPVVVKEDKKAAKEERKAQKEAEKAAKREALATAQAQEAAKVAEAEVYKPEPVYNGPTDEFIDTLSNAEKIEFSQIFLEQVNGSVKNIPAYVVGGENSKFFSNVFIYFVRVSKLVSDNLMNKFYEYNMA